MQLCWVKCPGRAQGDHFEAIACSSTLQTWQLLLAPALLDSGPGVAAALVLSRKKRMAGDAEKDDEGRKHITLLVLVWPCSSFIVNFQWVSVSYLTAEMDCAPILPIRLCPASLTVPSRQGSARCLSLPTAWEHVKALYSYWNVFPLVFESKNWGLFIYRAGFASVQGPRGSNNSSFLPYLQLWAEEEWSMGTAWAEISTTGKEYNLWWVKQTFASW